MKKLLYLLLVVFCTACDVPLTSSDLGSGRLTEDHASSSSLTPSCDHFGETPVLFDDFVYGARLNPEVNEAETLFGENQWWTCDGFQDAKMQSRAWMRYNRDEIGLSPQVAIETTQDGILKLRMNAGYTPASLKKNPMIVSGFKAHRGTYVARVRFSELEKGARLMQAFWTADYEGRQEMDFEWENWFRGDDRMRMSVTNHSRGGAGGRSLDCIVEIDGIGLPAPDCHRVGRNTQGAFSYLAPSRLEENPWLILMAVHHGDRVEYTVKGTAEVGAIRSVALDEGTDWSGPARLTNDVPDAPMHVLFSNQFANCGPGNVPPQYDSCEEHWFRDGQRVLTQDHEMQVDWFYYSPLVSLSVEDVEAHVRQLRGVSAARVNTSSLVLFPR